MKFCRIALTVLFLTAIIGCSEPSVTTRKDKKDDQVGTDVQLQKPMVSGGNPDKVTVEDNTKKDQEMLKDRKKKKEEEESKEDQKKKDDDKVNGGDAKKK